MFVCYISFPVAQIVAQRQGHGFDSQGKQELIKCKTVTEWKKLDILD